MEEGCYLHQIREPLKFCKFRNFLTNAQRLGLPQEHARPDMEELEAWLVANKDQLLPKSKIGQAIQYALNRWIYIKRRFDVGELEINYNLVENAIRQVAPERKN
ncbi:MAG: transposase [Saprospiraceae bacterium]